MTELEYLYDHAPPSPPRNKYAILDLDLSNSPVPFISAFILTLILKIDCR